MLEKVIEIEELSLNVSGVVSVKTVTKILEDGVVLSKSIHRRAMEKGADISDLPEDKQNLINTFWQDYDVVEPNFNQTPQ